ncbi:MAG: insulinase family protein [Desulfobacterota bacterium]|nr:insulinase family protein [Thermodesulfobacteriota bacterium]MDW8001924.1 pitrilysin family protein [Deltaproteobacteria bacterium]
MFRKTVLNNGLTVITESVPHFSTVSIGMWWKTGGRYENPQNNGISHFIEHMLFKGTEKRSAYEIAREIDAVGGTINAFTGKEYSCLYAKVLRKDVDLCLDILSDMYRHSLFSDEDIEKEKYVVTQEIRMIEDNPEEYIFDFFYANYFKNHGLGLPILGNKENVESFRRDILMEHFKMNYSPEKMVITASGRIEHEEFLKKIETLFGSIENEEASIQIDDPVPKSQTTIDVFRKDLESLYILVGTEGVSQIDEKRYILYLLNAIFGGSMSSRLFQEIREKRGLVYSIYSYVNCYFDTGTFGVSTSTSPGDAHEVIKLIKKEILTLKEKGISESELRFAKEHIKGNLHISLENTEARMGRIAKNEIYFGRYIPVRETLRAIDKVTVRDVNELAREIFSCFDKISLVILGDTDIEPIKEIWLN